MPASASLTSPFPAPRPERPTAEPSRTLRGAPPREWMLEMLSGAIDELDYGMLIVDEHGRILQANQVGHQHGADPRGACCVHDGRLHARNATDDALLHRAISQAVHGRRRTLLRLGEAPRTDTLAVVPLGHAGMEPTPGWPGAALLLFGKRQMCEVLSVEHYARAHGLTHAEGMVLAALCDGDDPCGIAQRFGVAVSTVRTQIASIRQKTRTASIRDLARQIAVLPPIVSALGHDAPH
ncbi:MAG: hypothetical protein RL456_270 [Pseudomonadota bacterium]